MSMKRLSLEKVRAVRLLRAGSSADEVSMALRLPTASVQMSARDCRNVPDEILALLEHALSDNEKLRRLIAGLLP
jgi:hypothetical protein